MDKEQFWESLQQPFKRCETCMWWRDNYKGMMWCNHPHEARLDGHHRHPFRCSDLDGFSAWQEFKGK